MSRPWTDDVVTIDVDGRSTLVTIKRSCNGCGNSIGDATLDEIDRAIAGLPLPDVRSECGCDESEPYDPATDSDLHRDGDISDEMTADKDFE